MDLDPSGIGERIRELRGDASQAEFAARVGSSRVSITRYESGERTPDAAFIAAVHVVLGVDPIWLLLGRGDAPRDRFSARELALIEKFRAVDDVGRKSIEHLAAALAGVAAREPPPKATHLTTFHGEVGAVHTVHEGSMSVTHKSPSKRGRNPPRG